MKLSEFDYALPQELIAQAPSPERDAARLFAHDLTADVSQHRLVQDLPDLLRAGDLLVANDTRVIPARCYGRRASGGEVEFLFLEPVGVPPGRTWRALVHPARKLKVGETVSVERGAFEVRMIERPRDDAGDLAPEWVVEVRGERAGEPGELLERFGRVPLPPYIRRQERDPAAEADRERYQTVFASASGAVAAPTAGLHFTHRLLEHLSERGIRRANVTLHVGYGTFQPLKGDSVEEQRLHSERFELSESVVEEIDRARKAGGRVVAVGTTSVRVLETCSLPTGRVEARSGRTDLFLVPGAPFRVVDALFTNFHLPRSSLLLLVCAFGGKERILRLYREAVDRRYRFYSYGDAMLLHGRPRD